LNKTALDVLVKVIGFPTLMQVWLGVKLADRLYETKGCIIKSALKTGPPMLIL
jgi:hypothetical protein